MKAKTKRIAIVTAAAIGSLWFFGFKKLQAAKTVMKNVKVNVKSITDFNLTWSTLIFKAVFTLTNLSKIDFGATLGSKIIIKSIKVYDKNGKYIGKGNTHITEIALPASKTVELPPVTIELQLKDAVNEFLTNTNAYLEKDFSNLIYKLDVEIFGKTVELPT